MRLAVWSGPRNLSTALMYSFAARGDFAIWDEPFYAAYLAETGLDHPMCKEVIAGGDVDAQSVASKCIDEIPDKKANFYLKVMPHHMLVDFPMDWAKECINVHLIRHPARVIASYAAKTDRMTLEDIGFRQQASVFAALGGYVVDSADIRANPRGTLAAICRAVGLEYSDNMLSWSAGGHKDDGPWAPHWYGAVHNSTGFAGPEGPLPILEGIQARLEDAALGYYEPMFKKRIKPEPGS